MKRLVLINAVENENHFVLACPAYRSLPLHFYLNTCTTILGQIILNYSVWPKVFAHVKKIPI